MSKAFLKEDGDAPPEEEPLPARPSEPLPITARGLDALKEELKTAEPRRKRVVARILETVAVRAPALENGGAGFGCRVTIEHEDGAQKTYELVGPDEADPKIGRVSIASPLARALLRQREGAVVTIKKPQGDEDVTVLSISECE